MAWPDEASAYPAILNITFSEASSTFSIAGKSTIIFGVLTNNLVTPTPTGGTVGNNYNFIWQQDATGGRNVTFDGVDYGSGAAGTHMVKSFTCVAANTFVLVGSS